jgi:hypothetical protein
MISSVVKDKVRLGPASRLKEICYPVKNLTGQLEKSKKPVSADTAVPFSTIRKELKKHLENKYGFDVIIYEETLGVGQPPEEETVRVAEECQLVIGIFGSTTGWKVPDQDPLSPTLREWRAALATPLKFRVFWLKDSVEVSSIQGELGKVLQELTDYKTGKTHAVFSDAVDLFLQVDRVVQDYIQHAIVRYVADTVNKERGTETQEWELSSYKERVEKMQHAWTHVEPSWDQEPRLIELGDHRQVVLLHAIPESLSVPESRKFVAYIFEDELKDRKFGAPGQLHIVAAFGSVTDSQIRHHLGNFESAEVYKGSWGLFGSDPGSGMQALYLPHCTNSLVMQAKVFQALDWVRQNAVQIIGLSLRRQQILDVVERFEEKTA